MSSVRKVGGDLTEAQDFIKGWLPGSVDRGGGRKRRFAETFATEQPDDFSLRGRNHCLPTAALSLPHPCPQVPGQSTIGPYCLAAAAPAPSVLQTLLLQSLPPLPLLLLPLEMSTPTDACISSRIVL
ncbi:uncharacterized protein LOC125945905 [Dermacentor silvarum]|uniref:uncharacterized protein LOC125945905 n=1 Tax=Dermacentor silvarum TaxID=543639 RepID=UPI00210186AD|nr:uncharacterized protein LOC125945905 [Dermacentor silvarum]